MLLGGNFMDLKNINQYIRSIELQRDKIDGYYKIVYNSNIL